MTRLQLSFKDLAQRLQSWEAHLKTGDTYQLRQQVFRSWIFTPPNCEKRSIDHLSEEMPC